MRSHESDECLVAVKRLKDGPADIMNIMCNQQSQWQDLQFTGADRYFFSSKFTSYPEMENLIDNLDLGMRKGTYKTERWTENWKSNSIFSNT